MRRLTFTYRNGTIELVSQQQVEMRLPAKTVSKDPERLPPFWYELRDARSEVLYRLDAPDPIPTDVEVFSDDPERTIERAPYAPEQGVFTVLVPEIEDAEEVLLMRPASATVATFDAESVVEVGRFKLTKE